MSLVFSLSRHTGVRLAEVRFLLILFAGVWLVAAQIPQLKLGTARIEQAMSPGMKEPSGEDHRLPRSAASPLAIPLVFARQSPDRIGRALCRAIFLDQVRSNRGPHVVVERGPVLTAQTEGIKEALMD